MHSETLSFEHLLKRYPDIAFHLTYATSSCYDVVQAKWGGENAHRGIHLLHSADDINREIVHMLAPLDLTSLEVLYIYGLGMGHVYRVLKPWLQEDRMRALVFLEDDLKVIASFLKSCQASAILSDFQVHLQYIPNKKQWKSIAEDLTQNFPSDRIGCTILPLYQRLYRQRWAQWRLQLMRSSAAIHALFSEALYPHRIFANVWANIQHLQGQNDSVRPFYANALAGRYVGMPAVICGAGPSLEKSLPLLRDLEYRALLIAGGSAIRALDTAAIKPHIAMALDPNPEEYDRLKGIVAEDVPLLYGNRVHPGVCVNWRGPLGYLRSDTGGIAESWLEEQLGITGNAIGPDLGKEAFSVTTLALAFAFSLGCSPIILTGVDLAYTGMRRYAPGVLEQKEVDLRQLRSDPRIMEHLLLRKDRQGKALYTLVKWVMEAEAITQFARQHPERLWINATEEGLSIPDIVHMPLAKAMDLYCRQQRDIRSMLHSEIAKCRISLSTPDHLNILREELRSSLHHCYNKIQAVLQELDVLQRDETRSLDSGALTILFYDIAEELSTRVLFPALGSVLDRLLQRLFPDPQDRFGILEREKHKWSRIQEVVESFSSALQIN